MDTISLVKNKQKELNKRVKTIKKDIKSDNIQIKDKPKNRKLKRFKKKAGGIIYLGHIPHGFYEQQMLGYFSQFGKVISAVVARSKKTGKAKGYGFVEFADEEVAKIAAETMNNYLMYNRIIKCRFIPPEERSRPLKPGTKFQGQRNKIMHVKQKLNTFKNVTPEKYKKKTIEKIAKFKKFFENRGIEFKFKVNENDSEENIKSKNGSTETEKTVNSNSEIDDNNQSAVLEIDESDDEIQFKTPPQVRKVIKKSFNSPATITKKSPVSKKGQLKNFKYLESPKPKKSETKKTTNKNTVKNEANQTSEKLKKKKAMLSKVKTNENVKVKSMKNGATKIFEQRKKNSKTVPDKSTKAGTLNAKLKSTSKKIKKAAFEKTKMKRVVTKT